MYPLNLPKRLTLELTNRCNRACTGCPRHQMTYPQGDISITLFTKVTSQLPDNMCIVPFFRGEPTLHPHFPALMPKLRRFQQVQIASNGDYLTKANRKAIQENCTFVSLSLHEYKLPSETEWVSFLYDLGGAGVTTQVSIVESELPKKRRNKFTAAWFKHVDRVRIYEEHSKRGFGSLPQRPKNPTCSKPFEDMVMYWDGKVGLCNHDWNNPFCLGDLNTQSVGEVWNDLKYQAVRGAHESGNRRIVPACEHCDFQSNKTYGELVQCQ